MPISAADLALTPTATNDEAAKLDSQQVSALAHEPAPTAVALSSSASEPRSAAAAPANLEIQPTPVDEVAAATVEATAAATPTPELISTPAPEPTAAITAAGGEEQVIDLVNSYRASHGLSTLTINANLMAEAASYAQLMAQSRWFYCGCDFHNGPDGSTPASRVAASGYAGRFWGEALAGGQGSPQAAVNGWLASPPHAAILLNPSAQDVGVGHFYNPADGFGHYWVLVTGIR